MAKVGLSTGVARIGLGSPHDLMDWPITLSITLKSDISPIEGYCTGVSSQRRQTVEQISRHFSTLFVVLCLLASRRTLDKRRGWYTIWASHGLEVGSNTAYSFLSSRRMWLMIDSTLSIPYSAIGERVCGFATCQLVIVLVQLTDANMQTP